MHACKYTQHYRLARQAVVLPSFFLCIQSCATMQLSFLSCSCLCMRARQRHHVSTDARESAVIQETTSEITALVVRVHIPKRLNDQRRLLKLVDRRGRRQAPLERLVHLRDHDFRVLRRRVLLRNAVYFAVAGESRDRKANGSRVCYTKGKRDREPRELQSAASTEEIDREQ